MLKFETGNPSILWLLLLKGFLEMHGWYQNTGTEFGKHPKNCIKLKKCKFADCKMITKVWVHLAYIKQKTIESD